MARAAAVLVWISWRAAPASVPLHPIGAVGCRQHLNIADMDWEDFAEAVDEGGGFCGCSL